MNVAEPFIKRPVATTLLVTHDPDLRHHGLPAAAGQRPADDRLPDHPGQRRPAGRQPGHDGHRRWRRRSRSSSRRSPASPRSARRNSQGSTNITLQFDLDRNIDAAAQDVQSMIARAPRSLPPGMPTPPSLPEGQPGRPAGPVPDAELDDAAAVAGRTSTPRPCSRSGCRWSAASRRSTSSARRSSRSASTSIRRQLAARQIGIDQVAAGDRERQRQPPDRHALRPAAQLRRADQRPADERRAATGRSSSPTATAARSGSSEVANVYDGVENPRNGSWYNGTPAIYLGDRSASPAPTPSRSSTRSRSCCRSCRRSCRRRSSCSIRSDRSVSIRESVDDVKFTLILTIVLVVLVIFLFLRNLSATIIPSLALPFSIVGTFAVM